MKRSVSVYHLIENTPQRPNICWQAVAVHRPRGRILVSNVGDLQRLGRHIGEGANRILSDNTRTLWLNLTRNAKINQF